MINLTSRTAKKRYHAYLIRQNRIFENKMYPKLLGVLKKQWDDVANQLEYGMANFQIARSDELTDVLRDYYLKIGLWYFAEANTFIEANTQKTFSRYRVKQEVDEIDFMRNFQSWVFRTSAEKVKYIQNTTRVILKIIINKGLKEGKTYYEVAKDIKKQKEIKNMYRAKRIATTELHTASMQSTQMTMEKAPIKIETKEWSTAGDARVRSDPFSHVNAEGEKVKLDEYFKETGESLMYPGDSMGSAANVVSCRCVSLYETEALQALKNYINYYSKRGVA